MDVGASALQGVFRGRPVNITRLHAQCQKVLEEKNNIHDIFDRDGL